MSMLIGTWGLYPWVYECGEDLVHYQDLNRFKERFLYSRDKLFFCIDEEDGYIVLRYRDELFRVKPDLYKRVRMPTFDYGDFLKLKDRPESKCFVDDICWNYDDEAAKYKLNVDGKLKSKWFSEKEFILE